MAVYDIDRILVADAPPEYEDHTRDVHYVPAPCQVACPIGTDAPSCIAHIWDEDYEGAFEAITATNPFSSICGRVCDAPCEFACRRVDSDGAVQIRNLKRFVMDKLIVWFGGARSGTDAAKLVGLGVNAVGYGVAVALALGGEITPTGMRFAPDRNEEERTDAVVNILKAIAGEASMMARCAGKTRLHNIEPEDLRSVTRATAAATGIPPAGTRAA